MHRREFLKSAVGAVALASIPVAVLAAKACVDPVLIPVGASSDLGDVPFEAIEDVVVKLPSDVGDSARRWMQLMYGTPVVYAPSRGVALMRVGDC